MSVPPCPIMAPGPTKGKQTLPLSPGFQLSHADLTVLPLFSRPFPRLSRKLRDPKTIAHSCIGNAFHKHARSRNICPNPQRISEVKQVGPRRLSKQQRRYREGMASSIVPNISHSRERPVGAKPGVGLRKRWGWQSYQYNLL